MQLDLPEEFVALCQRDCTKPETVLRGFIADLCWLETSDYMNHGSDERSKAEDYYERANYAWAKKDLICKACEESIDRYDSVFQCQACKKQVCEPCTTIVQKSILCNGCFNAEYDAEGDE